MSASAVNVDPAELGKFAAHAARWWDAGGAARPLHDLNLMSDSVLANCYGGVVCNYNTISSDVNVASSSFSV